MNLLPSSLLNVSFDKRLFIYLVSAFILFTAIGTITHELGHFFVAKLLGYHASISYAYTYTHFGGTNFVRDQALVTAGGILQTIVTGTIGCLLILYFHKKYLFCEKLNIKQWLTIFISLFWLRELFNFMFGIGSYFITNELSLRNDEIKLALFFNLPALSFSAPLALLAFFVLCWITLKIIPQKQRFTFLMSLPVGGILGFIFWIKLVGPIILP